MPGPDCIFQSHVGLRVQLAALWLQGWLEFDCASMAQNAFASTVSTSSHRNCALSAGALPYHPVNLSETPKSGSTDDVLPLSHEK
eukprot:2348512-Prymnesium_polylepis.1